MSDLEMFSLRNIVAKKNSSSIKRQERQGEENIRQQVKDTRAYC
jgi:hypothetical protein